MPPRNSMLPSTRESGLFSCTTEKVYLALALATIVWIGGMVTMIGVGGRGSLEHPTGPHSHSSDLSPRGYTDEHKLALHGAPGPSGDEIHSGSARSSHSRGAGLSRLDQLQKDLQDGLHNFFHHPGEGHWEEPTNRYGQAATKTSTTTTQGGSTTSTTTTTSPTSLDTTTTDTEPKYTGPPVVLATGTTMANPAIVVLTYKRKPYLIKTLDSVMEAPGVDAFKLYVSQDGNDPDLHDLPGMYAGRHELTLLNHPRMALMVADQGATAYLAQHYKWILDHLFLEKKHSHVVIMEDDMIVSPDFLSFFQETHSLLDSDPSVMCISSWNDNGMTRLVADSTRLMRTDYFPGLGWMTNTAIWKELSPQFPLDQWDHWMRLDTTHKGRDCIIPEVARNHNIGEEGTNMGQGFYGRFLAPIAFNKIPVSVLKTNPKTQEKDLSHMVLEEFEKQMQAEFDKSKILGMFGSSEVTNALTNLFSSADHAISPETATVVIKYTREMYPGIAAKLGLLPVPRSIHKGVISVRLGATLVYLADIKICPYLPVEHRFSRDSTLTPIAAKQNEPCTMACNREGKSCDAAHFQFINQCSELQKLFPCTKGCRGGVSGQDVPNYVDNPTKPELYGFCLTTEDSSTCESSHWSASRLCPCVIKK